MYDIFSGIAFGTLVLALLAEFFYIKKKDQRFESAALFSTKISIFAMLISIFAEQGLILAIIAEGKVRLIEYMTLTPIYEIVLDASFFFSFLFLIFLFAYYLSWNKLEAKKQAHILIGIMAFVSDLAIFLIQRYYLALKLTPITGAELYLPIHGIINGISLGMFAVAALAGFGYTISSEEATRLKYDYIGYLSAFLGLIFLAVVIGFGYIYTYTLKTSSPYIPTPLETPILSIYHTFYTYLWMTVFGAILCGVFNLLVVGGFKPKKLLIPEKIGLEEVKWRSIAHIINVIGFALLVTATWVGSYLLWQISIYSYRLV